jgi:hypothetical protein
MQSHEHGPDQEEAVHPVVSQALAAEHAKDMRARAAARELARTVRRNHHHDRASRAHFPVLRLREQAPATAQVPTLAVPESREPQPCGTRDAA